jgi:hypothetical protein
MVEIRRRILKRAVPQKSAINRLLKVQNYGLFLEKKLLTVFRKLKDCDTLT